MKNTFILIILSLVSYSCSKKSTEELLKQKNVELHQITSSKDLDTTSVNELRLYLNSALYSKKFMFKKFGKWSQVVKVDNLNNYYLIWNNVKLFKNSNKRFNIAAGGIEKTGLIYSSIAVWDQLNSDLFASDSELKDSLISYFYYGVKNTELSRDKFYSEYWKMRKELDQ